jgi:SAM-dependent methyltransferase
MTRPDWVPEFIDVSRPSLARGYDYLLGGSHNFAVDRAYAQKIIAAMPDVRLQVQENRAFSYRAVRYLVEAGVRQFLDIGSGIPTVGNVHEIAQRMDPDARVVYVDIDPVAAAHSEQILAGNDRAGIVQEDLRNPQAILNHPTTRELLDFDLPVGLLLVAILHALPDRDDPASIVAQLREALCPGSYLAIGHGTSDSRPQETGELARLTEQTTTPITFRTRPQIERFFVGLDLVEPGLVWAPLWRPESPGDVGEHPERASNLVGVGRKG